MALGFMGKCAASSEELSNLLIAFVWCADTLEMESL